MGGFDLLVRVNRVIFASGEVSVPPAMVDANDSRLNGFGEQSPEPIRAVVVEDLDLISIVNASFCRFYRMDFDNGFAIDIEEQRIVAVRGMHSPLRVGGDNGEREFLVCCWQMGEW